MLNIIRTGEKNQKVVLVTHSFFGGIKKKEGEPWGAVSETTGSRP